MSTDGIANHANSEGNRVALREPWSEIPSGQISPDFPIGGSAPESILVIRPRSRLRADRIAGFYRYIGSERPRELFVGGEISRTPRKVFWLLQLPSCWPTGWLRSIRSTSPAPHRQNHHWWPPSRLPPPLGWPGWPRREPAPITEAQLQLRGASQDRRRRANCWAATASGGSTQGTLGVHT